MAHPAYLREKARQMRVERRLTIDQLAERLALPRSTVYHWVRDLPIPGSGSGGVWPESAQRKGTLAMQRKYRLLREAAYREGLAEYEQLAADPGFRDFVCLYIAEGYKRNRNRVSLCNSDPAVMRHASRCIRRLSERTPFFSIQYHADQRLDELVRFWTGVVCVAPDEIRVLRKSNSNQLAGRAWRSSHGVLTVTVDDTGLRSRLQAWIDLTRSSWQ